MAKFLCALHRDIFPGACPNADPRRRPSRGSSMTSSTPRAARRPRAGASRSTSCAPISPATTATASSACRVTSIGCAPAISSPNQSSRLSTLRSSASSTAASASVRRWRRWRSTSALKKRRRPASPRSRCAIPAISAASANGRSAPRRPGLISIHFVNAAGSILVAPFGGLERRLSTAPFCVGVPREGAPPVVLDFATSLVAEGKVNVASHGGKPLPPDALIGPDGALSGDPALLYGPLTAERAARPTRGAGAIRAFGEHKGSGLALHVRAPRRLAHRQGLHRTGEQPRFANGMLSFYMAAVVLRHRRGLYGRRRSATSNSSRARARRVPAAKCWCRASPMRRSKARAPEERRAAPRRRLARHLRHGAGGRGGSGAIPGAATLGLPD